MIFTGLIAIAGGCFLSRFNNTGYPLFIGGAVLFIIGMFIAQNKSIAIGTNDVEGLHDRIKAVYPEAKLSKGDGAVIVEKRE